MTSWPHSYIVSRISLMSYICKGRVAAASRQQILIGCKQAADDIFKCIVSHVVLQHVCACCCRCYQRIAIWTARMRFQQARNLTLYCQSSPAIRYTSACFFHLKSEAKRQEVKNPQTPRVLTNIVHPDFGIALSSQCSCQAVIAFNLTMTPQTFVLHTLPPLLGQCQFDVPKFDSANCWSCVCGLHGIDCQYTRRHVCNIFTVYIYHTC